MKRTVAFAAILLGFTASFAAAKECVVNVAPDRERGILGDLMFYQFEPHYEVQIDTPTQPADIEFMIAIDGQETPDVLAFGGLDDLALSLASPNGDIAVDLDFVSSALAGDELNVFGFRNSSIVTFASYDLNALRIGLAECGII